MGRSFELGCNSFDTARIYRDSERTLGAWIREHRNRDKVAVISKGCHPDGSGPPRLLRLTTWLQIRVDSNRGPELAQFSLATATATGRRSPGARRPRQGREEFDLVVCGLFVNEGALVAGGYPRLGFVAELRWVLGG
ncbi:MAG: aldo/keto reductase [Mycobacterium sp.]|nr:aldo/keto reductase [Mycobacterium sp.]